LAYPYNINLFLAQLPLSDKKFKPVLRQATLPYFTHVPPTPLQDKEGKFFKVGFSRIIKSVYFQIK
jgi:hypothetical protein